MAKKKTNAEIVNFVLEGEIFWPSFFKADTYDKYGCVLGNLTPAEVEKAEEANLVVRNDKPEFGSYVRIQRKKYKKDYKTDEIVEDEPLEVMDADRRKWDPSVGIGNGTLAKVKGINIQYDADEDKWTSKAQKIKILNLVEFALSADGDNWDMVDEDDEDEDTSPEDTTDDFGDELPDSLLETDKEETVSELD